MFLLDSSFWELSVTANKGRGIFAAKDIRPGTIIGDYLGKIIHPEEEDEASQGGLYAMSWHDEVAFLPVDLQSTDLHCLNHSCASNCGIYPYKGHILYAALRHIFAGEELLVNYMIMPIPENNNSYLCHCNEEFCKGTMFCNFRHGIDFWDHYIWEAQKPYFSSLPGFGQPLLPLPEYPREAEDHPIHNLFGNTQVPPQVVSDMSLPSLSSLRQQIRSSGQTISFPNLNITLLGIAYPQLLLVKPS